MNRPLDEVRRLRAALADKSRELTELRGLVQKHFAATSEDEHRALEREQEAYERGQDPARRDYGDGFTLGHDVALGAHEEARPFVAGVREGFEAGQLKWQETASEVFKHLHQRPQRQQPKSEIEVDTDYELEAG